MAVNQSESLKSESFLELEIQILNGIAYRYGRYLEVCRANSLCKKEDVRDKNQCTY